MLFSNSVAIIIVVIIIIIIALFWIGLQMSWVESSLPPCCIVLSLFHLSWHWKCFSLLHWFALSIFKELKLPLNLRLITIMLCAFEGGFWQARETHKTTRNFSIMIMCQQLDLSPWNPYGSVSGNSMDLWYRV